MTREEARAYVDRWKPLEQLEQVEAQATSTAERFDQLAGLMATARALDWQTTDEGEVEAVRARWARLRMVALRG